MLQKSVPTKLEIQLLKKVLLITENELVFQRTHDIPAYQNLSEYEIIVRERAYHFLAHFPTIKFYLN